MVLLFFDIEQYTQADMKLPNILFILIDCARSDKILGPARTTVTPNLDLLASNGVSFPTTIAEKSFTTPALASLLTGLYSPRHGVHAVFGYQLQNNIPLFTHALSGYGYKTYAEVTGPLIPELGFDRAFDHYDYRAPCDYLHTKWGEQLVKRLNAGYYRSPWFLLLHLFELHVERQIASDYAKPAYGRNKYEQAVSCLDPQLRRIFSSVGDNCFILVTGDHGEKTEEESIHRGTSVTYVQKLLKLEDAKGMSILQIANMVGPSIMHNLLRKLTPIITEAALHDDKQNVSFSWLARIIDKLRLLWLVPRFRIRDLRALNKPLELSNVIRQRGVLDKTFSQARVEKFIKMIGNEDFFKMQMRMLINSFKSNIQSGHGFHVYDYLVKVPLIMCWSQRIKKSIVCDRMIRQPDILPTVLDILDLKSNDLKFIDGRSFKAILENKPWAPLPAYLSVTGVPKEIELHGVRTEKFKYTFNPYNPEMPEELYDLSRDTNESNNIAAYKQKECKKLRKIVSGFIPDENGAQVGEMIQEAEDQKKMIKLLKALGYIN